MIVETTWHPQENQQTTFVWSAAEDGIHLYHCHERQPYNIPWKTFSVVSCTARQLALQHNGTIAAGTNENNPPDGSVGQWVRNHGQQLPISNGQLTPRHLSFIGPILGRMGFADREVANNAIYWRF